MRTCQPHTGRHMHQFTSLICGGYYTWHV